MISSGVRILSDEQIEEMAFMREEGVSLVAIAAHFTKTGTPISDRALHWQCLRVGADSPPEKWSKLFQPTKQYFRNGHLVRPFTPEDDALLLALDLQGFNQSVMARRLSRKPNTIKGRLMTLARRDARREILGEAA